MFTANLLLAQIPYQPEKNRFSSGNDEELNLIGNPGAFPSDSLLLYGLRYTRNYWLKELDKKMFLLSLPFLIQHRVSVAVSDRGFSLYREQDYGVQGNLENKLPRVLGGMFII